MKIAITSQSITRDSQLDPRFGRVKNFLIHNDEDNSWEAVNNKQNLEATQGDGIRQLRWLPVKIAVLLLPGIGKDNIHLNIGTYKRGFFMEIAIPVAGVDTLCPCPEMMDEIENDNLKVTNAFLQGISDLSQNRLPGFDGKGCCRQKKGRAHRGCGRMLE